MELTYKEVQKQLRMPLPNGIEIHDLLEDLRCFGDLSESEMSVVCSLMKIQYHLEKTEDAVEECAKLLTILQKEQIIGNKLEAENKLRETY